MSQFAYDLIGEGPVHPGHPLTIALVIMSRFASLDEARLRGGSHNYPAALTEGDIPGAGGEVYSALALLSDIEAGTVSVADAPAEAARRWADSGAGGHTDRVAPGQIQANRLSDDFISKAREWLNRQPAALPA